ncbi:MAG: histidine triad nucleotide-binding protein [Candidatus Marinimicrobia bacterium]|nr:histidine triad nucleotide-binding protein [Candidatus Neomarinimicrobiota bacterium]
MEENCIFCKLIAGEMPVEKLYEDEEVMAFNDINPQAPTHFLVIPKQHIAKPGEIGDGDEPLVGKLIHRATRLAHKLGLGNGYRMVINHGDDGGQTVFHLHVHVMGGRRMLWPPG